MNWIKLTKINKPKFNEDVLVRFNSGSYMVSHLIDDSEYGHVWVDFETYHAFDAITHYCYIEKP